VNEDHELGAHGEEAAVRYLQGKGFKFITRGFKTQRGEVDAILRDKDVWVFLEVKTRREISDYPAVESVTRKKQQRIMNAALMYMKMNGLMGQDMRFDVIVIEDDGFEWIPNAFENPGRYSF
jgi:putative endonuclease